MNLLEHIKRYQQLNKELKEIDDALSLLGHREGTEIFDIRKDERHSVKILVMERERITAAPSLMEDLNVEVVPEKEDTGFFLAREQDLFPCG